MPKSRATQMYQDYVCGTALRICGEIFAALPVSWVLVTIRTEMLDEATGHVKTRPILSLMTPRASADSLNYSTVDPSEAMKNFLHRMDFKKTTGLSPIVGLTIEDLPTTPS
jgi:hypothetical protein